MRLLSKTFFISEVNVSPCYSLQSSLYQKIHTGPYQPISPWSVLWCYFVRMRLVHCHFVMNVFSWLKMASFDRTCQFWEKKTLCCARSGTCRACWSIEI